MKCNGQGCFGANQWGLRFGRAGDCEGQTNVRKMVRCELKLVGMGLGGCEGGGGRSMTPGLDPAGNCLLGGGNAVAMEAG